MKKPVLNLTFKASESGTTAPTGTAPQPHGTTHPHFAALTAAAKKAARRTR